MQIGDFCRNGVTVVNRDSTVLEAAQMMRRYHIGAVVVVDVMGESQVPVGIVTDRDIVLAVVAMSLEPRSLSAGDIMGDEVVTVPEDCEVHEAIATMRKKGVRRMPIVKANGALAGIVTLDDLLPMLSEELADLAKLPLAGRKREFATRH
jgi:CBS domain-containing protein